jgi:hypothetical protein
MDRLNLRDVLAGLIFILIGASFALSARSIEIGTAFRMGPGYFPLLLSGLLMLIGAVIALSALANGTNESLGPVPWRGLVLVLAAPVVFGLTVRRLGLVPAIVGLCKPPRRLSPCRSHGSRAHAVLPCCVYLRPSPAAPAVWPLAQVLSAHGHLQQFGHGLRHGC